MKNKIYSTKVTATGGRRGHVTSENGELDIDVRMPGSNGNYLNPEILFAAGYSACFDNAVIGVIREMKIKGVTHATTVGVTLGEMENGGYGFEIDIEVAVKGIDLITAEKIIQAAHQVCPYSNLSRGNAKVGLSVKELVD